MDPQSGRRKESDQFGIHDVVSHNSGNQGASNDNAPGGYVDRVKATLQNLVDDVNSHSVPLDVAIERVKERNLGVPKAERDAGKHAYTPSKVRPHQSAGLS